MHHGHRFARRGCDHINFPMHAGHFFHHHHGEIAGAGGYIACSHPDGIGGGHASARIALRRRKENARAQIAIRIQERCAAFSQPPCVRTGRQHPGQHLTQLPSISHLRDQAIKLIRHILAIIQRVAVNGKHAGGFANAQHFFPGKTQVDIPCQRGQEAQLRQMGFAV